MEKRSGYASGIDPAFDFYDRCKVLGTEEVSFYGLAQENTRRPRDQREAFQKACVDGVKRLEKRDADLLIVGDSDTPMFPPELKRYTERTRLGKGGLRIDLLINYSWRGPRSFKNDRKARFPRRR